MGEHDATLVLIFSGSFILLTFAIIMYFVAKAQRRLNALESNFNRIMMKLRTWDALIYGFDDEPEPTTQYRHHDNVVYLTPPNDD